MYQEVVFRVSGLAFGVIGFRLVEGLEERKSFRVLGLCTLNPKYSTQNPKP